MGSNMVLELWFQRVLGSILSSAFVPHLHSFFFWSAPPFAFFFYKIWISLFALCFSTYVWRLASPNAKTGMQGRWLLQRYCWANILTTTTLGLLKNIAPSIARCVSSFNWVTQLVAYLQFQKGRTTWEREREHSLYEMGYWKMLSWHAENLCVCSYPTLQATWKNVSQINYLILLSKQTFRTV